MKPKLLFTNVHRFQNGSVCKAKVWAYDDRFTVDFEWWRASPKARGDMLYEIEEFARSFVALTSSQGREPENKEIIVELIADKTACTFDAVLRAPGIEAEAMNDPSKPEQLTLAQIRPRATATISSRDGMPPQRSKDDLWTNRPGWRPSVALR